MPVVIKVLFPVLVLCTLAVVAVVMAIHFRVKKHLREEPPANPASELLGTEGRTEAELPHTTQDAQEDHPS
jgi:hypothetical protein